MNHQSNLDLARHYDIVLHPHVTEKSTLLSEVGKVVFKVSSSATKVEIKAAIESIFRVKVSGVNVINTRGKTRFFRGRKGRRSDFKKAIITLAAGESIDFETV